jgi:hypothetical protein
MKPEEEKLSLSFRERCEVVGLALGFLVIGVLWTLLVVESYRPSSLREVLAILLSRIQKHYQSGNTHLAVAECFGWVFALLAIILIVLALMQGVLGWRTSLTRQIVERETRNARGEYLIIGILFTLIIGVLFALLHWEQGRLLH